jgi:ABC-type proline/glycine betaine transport system ATPase subunit
VVLVTHDVDEAFRLVDRIVVMREGRIEQAGAPFDVFHQPATPYVRQLVHAGDEVYLQYYLRTRELLRAT